MNWWLVGHMWVVKIYESGEPFVFWTLNSVRNIYNKNSRECKTSYKKILMFAKSNIYLSHYLQYNAIFTTCGLNFWLHIHQNKWFTMNYSLLKPWNKNTRNINPFVSSRYELMPVRLLKAGQVRKRKGHQGLWGGEGGDGKRRLYRLC